MKTNELNLYVRELSLIVFVFIQAYQYILCGTIFVIIKKIIDCAQPPRSTYMALAFQRHYLKHKKEEDYCLNLHLLLQHTDTRSY